MLSSEVGLIDRAPEILALRWAWMDSKRDLCRGGLSLALASFLSLLDNDGGAGARVSSLAVPLDWGVVSRSSAFRFPLGSFNLLSRGVAEPGMLRSPDELCSGLLDIGKLPTSSPLRGGGWAVRPEAIPF